MHLPSIRVCFSFDAAFSPVLPRAAPILSTAKPFRPYDFLSTDLNGALVDHFGWLRGWPSLARLRDGCGV